MAITAEKVKELRDKTGAGMMDCKRALEQTDGDFEKAVDLLRQKGLAVAAKRESKIASEGIIASHVDESGKVGAMLELNCETDFVARTDEFQELARSLARLVAGNDPSDVPALLALPGPGGDAVQDLVTETIGKLGEKIEVNRFIRCAVGGSGSGVISAYIHTGGKIGVLVELDCESDSLAANPEFRSLAHEIAMQIAWSNPSHLRRDEIPAAEIEREREVHRQWAKEAGKPEQAIEKIVDGKMEGFFANQCLEDQPYVRNPDMAVKALIAEQSGKLGENITISRFVRFRVGESDAN